LPVKEYLDALQMNERAKVAAFIGLLEENGPNLKRPYADFLKDGIHELRIKVTGTQTRILYFFCHEDQIILTNIFEKRTSKVPEKEIDLAKERRTDFLKHFTERKGEYK
jgi:phage-related protein